MMWTAESRGRMAKIEKKTKRYPCDVSDEEWSAVEPLMSQAHATGRRRQRDFRDILDANSSPVPA